jgi:hypothetical protein
MEEIPTYNERVLAGAMMVMMGTQTIVPPKTGTVVPIPYILPQDADLNTIRVGYQMMGISDLKFIQAGAEYREILGPAIDILYDRFAIVEQVMNS